MVSAWFIESLGLTGSTVILVAMILSFMPLMIGFSWLKVGDFIGIHLHYLMDKIAEILSKLLSAIQWRLKENAKKKEQVPQKDPIKSIKKPLKEKVVQKIKQSAKKKETNI